MALSARNWSAISWKFSMCGPTTHGLAGHGRLEDVVAARRARGCRPRRRRSRGRRPAPARRACRAAAPRRRATPPGRGRCGAGSGSPRPRRGRAPRRSARGGAGRRSEARLRHALAHAVERREHQLLLAAHGAARDPERPRRRPPCEEAREPLRAGRPGSTASNFRLPVTWTRSAGAAQRADALGVGLALHQEEVDLGEHRREEARARACSAGTSAARCGRSRAPRACRGGAPRG